MTTLLPRVRAMLVDRRSDESSEADLLRTFIATRDEQAFAALVRRHGPLVRATARRALGDAADADDVFQAVFLLLARSAGSIRNPAAVAGWLHGVAHRMARTTRRAATRRKAHETRVPQRQLTEHCDLTWREVEQAFEDELARLPDRYRVPFVLCVLNTEPRADVARRLGIREGTISSRLAEAKRRLCAQLTARGITLSAILGMVSLPTISVSADLIARTVRLTSGQRIPAGIAALVRNGVGGMRTAAIASFLLVATGITMVMVGRPTDVAGGAPPPPAKEPPTKVASATPGQLVTRGIVVDAAGKPVADASVRLWSFRDGDIIPEPKTKTGPDGKFRFDADANDVNDSRVVVTPKGQPAQWLPLARFNEEQTLRLPADDVPFTGRVMSLENQPLKGATVEVVRVSNVATGELTTWLVKNVAMRKDSNWLNEGGLIPVPGAVVLPFTKATTDADGRFKLTGFGRNRVLTVRVSGPNVETKFFWVASRPGGPADGYIRTSDFNHGVYGPDVMVMLAPSRPLIGTVRDAKTGKPVAGVIVSEVNNHIPRSVTDKDGRYRIEGVPKKPNYGLNVAGTKGTPYFDFTHMWVSDVAGLDPLTTDLTIHRGLEFAGRVVDKATGKPVRAEAMYFPRKENDSDALRVISSDGWRTKPDGTFYLTAHSGKGVLVICADDANQYATADPRPALAKIGNRSMPFEAGRELLRKRLVRRGITLSAGLLAAVAQPVDGRSATTLMAPIVNGTIRPGAIALSKAVRLGARMRIAVIGLAASVVMVGVALGFSGGQKPEPPKDKATPAKPMAKTNETKEDGPKGERIAFSGRVVDPNGKAVKGAKVYLLRHRELSPGPEADPLARAVDTSVKATTDADGRYVFDVTSASYPQRRWSSKPQLVALADGFGIGMLPAQSTGLTDGTIPLVVDHPIKGRIINLEGKPVAGIKIRVVNIQSPAVGDLAEFVKATGTGRVSSKFLESYFPLIAGDLNDFLPVIATAKTDQQGRFEIHSVGRDRMVLLQVEGGTVAPIL